MSYKMIPGGRSNRKLSGNHGGISPVKSAWRHNSTIRWVGKYTAPGAFIGTNLEALLWDCPLLAQNR